LFHVCEKYYCDLEDHIVSINQSKISRSRLRVGSACHLLSLVFLLGILCDPEDLDETLNAEDYVIHSHFSFLKKHGVYIAG
jgi:hypothetical protein